MYVLNVCMYVYMYVIRLSIYKYASFSYNK